MALKEFFTDIFGSLHNTSTAEMTVYKAWVQAYSKDELDQRTAAQRLVDYMERDTAGIKESLKLAARLTFGDDVSEWQLPIINVVPRIVKRISLAYVQPPQRVLELDGKEIKSGDKLWEAVYGDDGMFKLVDIDRKYKEMDNWSTLLNTVHTEVVPRKDAIDWDLRLRPSVSVIPDPEDYLKFAKFAYAFNPMDPLTLKVRKGWVYWSDKLHAYRMDNGEWYNIDTPDGSNPYGGKIPIVTVRKLEQDEYWGRFGADLVDACEQANIQLCNMWFNAFMQTHGQPVGTNLKLPAGSRLRTGPNHPIMVDGVTKDDVPPGLAFAKPDTDIATVKEMIDWFLKNVAQAYGLPPGSWSIDAVPESGFAKFMNNIELLENRDDSRAMWEQVEQELFDASVMVYNRWAGEQGHGTLPEGLRLRVEFGPVKFPESPTEKMQRYTLGSKAGITSPVRYFMEEEGLDEDEALKKAIKVALENEQIETALRKERMKNMPAEPAMPWGNKGGAPAQQQQQQGQPGVKQQQPQQGAQGAPPAGTEEGK